MTIDVGGRLMLVLVAGMVLAFCTAMAKIGKK